tara:strand:- start:119 stop:565 length:447 start_codon:yes stop_codon:yes gene_type:complete
MFWVFSSFLIIISIFVVYGAYKNYRRAAELIQYRQALAESLQTVRGEITKNEKLISRAKNLVGANQAPDGEEDFSSPAFLSTVIGALVIKFGSTRLSLQDILKVGDDYVSVYVDGRTQELILSMNHELDIEDPLSMVSYSTPDDKIFH